MARKNTNEPDNKAALRLGQFLAERGLDKDSEKAYPEKTKEKPVPVQKTKKKANPKKSKSTKKSTDK